VLVGLCECKWEKVPQDLAPELEFSFLRQGTKSIEDIIGYLRLQTKSNKMGSLGPIRQWHHLVESRILQDEDQRPISKTPEDTNPVMTELTEEWLAARHHCFSLGEDKLDDLMSGRGWPHPGPVAYMEVPVATSALLHLYTDLGQLKTLLLSKLAMAGWLIHLADMAPSSGGLVCYSCQHGIVLYKVLTQDAGDATIIKLAAPVPGPTHPGSLGIPWKLGHITEHTHWVARKLVATPPNQLDAALGSDCSKQFSGIVLTLADEEFSLMEAAGASCFPKWTVAELQWLIKQENFPTPGGMPTLERDCVNVCVKGALPYLLDDEVHDLVELRSCRKKKSMESVVTAANVDDLQGALDQDDYAVVASAVKKGATAKTPKPAAAKPVRQHVPPVADAPPVQAEVASGSGDVAQYVAAQAGIKNNVPRPAADAKYSLEEARRFLPHVPGCILSIHSGRAWQVKYMKAKGPGPKSHMCTWLGRAALSYNQALKDTLEWAWEKHLEAHPGESCPWDFGTIPG